MDRLKKSCCFLYQKGVGVGQGIIIQHRGELYLMTCHHVIPSKRASTPWNIIIYTESGEPNSIRIDESIVGRCISCCGEDGILGKYEHFHDLCPFDLDFILLKLNNSKLEEMLSEFVDLKLSIDALKVLERVEESRDFFYDGNASCFYMRNTKHQLIIKEHYFSFSPLPTGPLKISILRDWSFEVAYFEVIKDDRYDVCGGGSSGAPMYATHMSKQPVLIGMHISRDDDEEDKVASDEYKSFNTNFIWLLYIINLYSEKHCQFFPDFPLTKTAMHKSLLWAVFLRYQKKSSMLKKRSLLVKIAQEIYGDLYRSKFQAQLEGEEKEMFDMVDQFLSDQDPAEALVIGIEGASINLPPRENITTGYVTDTNNPYSDNNPPEELPVTSKDKMV